jgi:diguanylate cyclase (GGDEF)-like protein
MKSESRDGVVVWLQRSKQAYDLAQGVATVESLRRFRSLALFTVPLHFVLAAWFARYRTSGGRQDLISWADALFSVHATTGAIVLVLAVFVHWILLPQGRATAAGIALQVLLCITYLGFAVVTSVIDVGVAASGGISAYIMVSIAVAMVSLMRPSISVPLFLSGLLAFGLALSRANVDAAMAPSLVINSVAVTFLAIIASLIIWRQYVNNVLLQRELTQANAVLIARQGELEILSERDALTGLYNRRKLLQLLEIEMDRSLRSPQGLSLVMLDLDHFERVNDLWGQPAGDEVLRQIVGMLLESVRSMDVVARLDGDAFLILLPNTDKNDAIAVAEKLRAILRRKPAFWQGHAVQIRASLGVSGLAFNELSTVGALYTAADRALLDAKQGGRDRVVYVAPRVSTEPATFQTLRA